ncbi:hypothetical protein BS47DRAFT_1353232 [Hydnum rufescens UP504]|uniref:Uncharacterized protein n=1 Tax=Hydnum rufescens UP504 TaxID=1448309 RepID=A0A9P6AHR5_9AGAM|nr:hypothetical protein BS47DRAFT_1353232 [Hydnum rufescens UP504]
MSNIDLLSRTLDGQWIAALSIPSLEACRLSLRPLDGEPREFPEVDIVHRGHGTTPPSALLLDYMYGVALYKHWGVGGEF